MKNSKYILLAVLVAGLTSCQTQIENERTERIGSELEAGSCQSGADDFCGGPSDGDCWCDDKCAGFGDCCADIDEVCNATAPPATNSCVASCGGQSASGNCYCDDQCAEFGDCCSDFAAVCTSTPPPPPPPASDSCVASCGGQSASGNCYCDDQCSGFGDCCGDYTAVCDSTNPPPPPVANCDQDARYRVTANFTWNPSNVPNPHWSPLIGATHNAGVTIWDTGVIASNGVKVMAETGSPAPLAAEIQSLNGANQVLQGSGPVDSPGVTSLEFDIQGNFSVVTLSTMVAPSPDWFVGVSGLDLCGANGWIDSVNADLRVLDAGTDSGTFYTSANAVTSPQQPIEFHQGFVVNGQPFPLGSITFQRIQ